MSNVIFTYNEEAALTAGQGGFINETGAHIITITEAELKQSEKEPNLLSFLENPTTDVKSNILAFVFRKMTERKTSLAQTSFMP